MTAQKTERLMGLLIMLLAQRHWVDRNRIRTHLYPGLSDDAFDKKFERDKEELRSLGVPIELGSLDPFFGDEPGYRIRPDEFALPEIRLDADEASALALAGKVWAHARLAGATTEALRKLAADGVEVESGALELALPRVATQDPAFGAFMEAVITRTPLRFDYSRAGAEPTSRRLWPWGVVRHSGRWYAVGHDLDRQEERVFRLSRVHGEPQADGDPGSFEVPPDVDVNEVAHRLARPTPPEPATVLVRPGTCASLRRTATVVTPDVPGPADTGLWDRLELDRADLAPEILACGASAYVESPAALREQVLTRLEAALAGAQDAS